MNQEGLSFKVEGGMSYRKDEFSNWIPATDSAQPNPDYKPNPGIHGWVCGKRGYERIDVAPGEEIAIPFSVKLLMETFIYGLSH